MKITDVKTFVIGNPWKNWIFVKVVTERHGGTIHVESVPDEGSCFRLALPRIDVGGL